MNDVVAAAAREWCSTPFHWEAAVKGVGCDCRGLLTGVARELGRPEAGTIEANIVGYSRRIDETALLAGLDRVFKRKQTPKPGDILAFRIRDKVQHLGICTGDRFVHAYSLPPRQVIETPLSGLWLNRLAGVWAWR
jgi:NlpC/P60 family putative phage cell wall peptidase